MLSRYLLLVVFIIMISNQLFAKQDSVKTNYGSITVIIQGFENKIGNCRFAIDNSESMFESDDSVFIGKILAIFSNEVIVKIDFLEFGEYAIKVFHDENKNGELDTDFLGIPTENYGYSNNASSWFGPPSWENAKFLFNKREMTIEIKID